MPEKKTTKKRTTRKPVAASMAMAPQESSTTTKSMSTKKSQKKNIIIIGVVVILLAIAMLAYKNRGLVVAATVNGQPISRLAIISQLEKQGGKQALSDAITQSLVTQEAKKEGITVSDDELNTEVKKLQDSLSKQGQNLDQLLAAQQMSMTDLRDRIRLQKIVEKKFGTEITVTDKEVDDYMNANQSQLPEGTNLADARASAKTQLQQQKMQTKVQAWLADLQKNAKIDYFVSY